MGLELLAATVVAVPIVGLWLYATYRAAQVA